MSQIARSSFNNPSGRAINWIAYRKLLTLFAKMAATYGYAISDATPVTFVAFFNADILLKQLRSLDIRVRKGEKTGLFKAFTELAAKTGITLVKKADLVGPQPAVTAQDEGLISIQWEAADFPNPIYEYVLIHTLDNVKVTGFTSDTNILFTDLEIGDQYTFQLRAAYRKFGIPFRTPYKSVTTYANAALNQAMNVTLQPDEDGGVLLDWDVVPNATSYDVQRSTTPDFSAGVISQNIVATLLYYENPDVVPDAHYYYRIKAKAVGWGDSPWSEIDGFSWAKLATPTGLAATPIDDTQIDLDWDEVTDATEYIVLRAEQADYSDQLQVYNGAVTAFSDTLLTAATTYYYRVYARAVDKEASAYAEDSAATTA